MVASSILLSANPVVADTFNDWWCLHFWDTASSDPGSWHGPQWSSASIYWQVTLTSAIDISGNGHMKFERDSWSRQCAAVSGGFTLTPDNSMAISGSLRLGGSAWSCSDPADIWINSMENTKTYVINLVDTGTVLADTCNDNMAAFVVNEVNHRNALVDLPSRVEASNSLSTVYLNSRSTAEYAGSCEEVWFMYTTNNWTSRSYVEITNVTTNTTLTLPIGTQVNFGSLIQWIVETSANTDTATVSGTTSGSLNFDAMFIKRYDGRNHWVAKTLLQNYSFELAPTTNSPNEGAYNWKLGDPNTRGAFSNSVSREEWRAHSGYWQYAFKGTWATAGDHGTAWQEVTNRLDPGSAWVAGAWFYNDTTFTCSGAKLKIEFYDGSGTRLGGNTNNFSGSMPGEAWTYYSVGATCPVGTAWTRFQMDTEGVGANGALQMDDAVLWGEEPSATYVWDASAYPDRDWSNPTNWEGNQEPISISNAYINGSYTGEVTQAGEVAKDLFVGSSAKGTLIQSGGSLSVTNLFMGFSSGGSGAVYVTGGTLTSRVNIGVGYSGAGSLVVSGAAAKVVAGGNLDVGFSNSTRYAFVNQYAGTVTVANIYLGKNSATEGSYMMTGGVLSVGTSIYMADGNANATGRMTVAAGRFDSGDDFYIGRTGLGIFTVTGTATVSLNTTSAHIYIGSLANNNKANRVQVDGGRLNVGGNIYAGYVAGTYGAITVSGGVLSVTNDIFVANNASSTGTLTMTGGVLDQDGAGDVLYVGQSGLGTMMMGGGTATVGGLFVGMNAGSIGLLSVTGGTLNVSQSDSLSVGYYGAATMNIGNNATINVGDGSGDTDFYVGRVAGSAGMVNQSNGTVTITAGSASHLRVGDSGYGTYNLSGGVLSIADHLFLADQGTSTGRVYVTGGTMAIHDTLFLGYNSGSIGLFQMTGGSCTADAAQVSIVSGANGLMALSGGSMSVVGSGNLQLGVNGTGTLNMAGTAALYVGDNTGETDFILGSGAAGVGIINQSNGTITIQSSTGDSVLKIADGASSRGFYTMSGGGLGIEDHLWIGSAAGGVGTFRVIGNGASIGITNDLTVQNGSSTIAVSFVSSAISPILVGDDITLTGALTVSDDGSMTDGSYTIATSLNNSAVSGYFTATNWLGTKEGTVSYANGAVVITFSSAAADIRILGTNGTFIADGSSSPSNSVGTDFGDVATSGGTREHTFTVTNSGSALLNLDHVAIGGTHASDFSVSSDFSFSPTNLLLNSDFALDGVAAQINAATINNWGTWGPSGWYNSDIDSQMSVKLWYDDSGLFQDWTCAGSAVYELNVYARQRDAEPLVDWQGYLKVEFYDAGNGLLASQELDYFLPTDPTNQWILLTGCYTSPAASAYGRIVLGVKNWTATVSGAVFFDNARVFCRSLGVSSTATFKVTFDPSAAGTRTAMLYITNNVSSKSPYNFVLQGTGTYVEIAVTGNGSNITDGSVSPVTNNYTDFGNVGLMGSTLSRTFTISNSGNRVMGLGTVTTSGTHATNFVITTQPTSPLNPSNTTTFVVQFDPSAVGLHTAALSFTNTDDSAGDGLTENPFNFSIQGTGNAAGISNSPASISVSSTLGSAPASVGFGVTNIGLGTLSYAVSTNASWLTVSPVSGSLAAAAGQQHTVTFAVPPGVQAGTSNATITITDANASNSPQTIAVAWTINAISDPSAATLTADGRELVRLNWTKHASYDVMIVYRSGSAPTDPTQGTAYSVGSACGGGTVLYKGSGAHLEHVLASGTTHYYEFYSYSGNYYSPGLARNVTLPSYSANEIVEPFAYTNGVSLAGLNGGNGWTNTWTVGAGTWTAQTNVESCTFINMQNYPNMAAQRVKLTNPDVNGSGTARRHFPAVTNGSIYASVMMAYSWEGASKYAGLSFMNGSVETGFVGKGYGANWYTLAIASYGGATEWSSYDLRGLETSTNSTYLLIARYNFSTKQLSTKAYYRTNGLPLSEPASWDATVTVPGDGITRIDGVRISGGAGDGGAIGNCYFDEVRVAGSWTAMLGLTQPVATNYSVNTSNYVSDAQITGGVFNVSMYLRDTAGIETTNTSGAFFQPNFDLWNSVGIQILTDEVFNSFTYQDNGQTVYASDSSHAGAAYDVTVLGTYTSRWSAINSNYVSTLDATTLSNGTAMTFTVYDDDTNAPITFDNRLRNPSFEINGTTAASAWGWEWNNPDQHGSTWDRAMLWTPDGFAHTGTNSASLLWNDGTTFSAGWWQEVTNDTPIGTLWTASAWFRRDNNWTALWYNIKIELYNYDRSSKLSETDYGFTIPADTWTNISCVATTVDGTCWVRFLASGGGIGPGGIMRIDDAYLAPSASMQVYIGTTNYPNSNISSNGIVTLTDADLAAVGALNPLKVVIPAYDEGSGLSRGTTDSATQMNLDFGSWLTDNVTNYDVTLSTPDADTFTYGATSTWKFANVLVDSLALTTNKISVSVFDKDADRTDDRRLVTNQQYGYIVVNDDDVTYPMVGNVLQNPGFEIGAVGSTNAWHWSWDYPDTHSAHWGQSVIGAFQTVGGSNSLYFRNWDATADGAGIWQEVTNSAGGGVVWYASAWCWKDAAYTNGGQQLAIQFYDASGTAIGGQTNVFSLPNDTWTLESIMATSPAGTVHARYVLNTWSQGQTGVMDIDELCFMPVPALRIRIGSTYLTPSDFTTNARFYVDSSLLGSVSGANPMYFWFTASDADSGLSRGTTDSGSQMNVDIGAAITDDVTHFVLSNSTTEADTRLTTATNAWVWYGFNSAELASLTNSVTNKIVASVFDNDTDRTGDQLIVINQQYGLLIVTSAPPVQSAVIYDGFASASGTLEGGSGGTGWSNNWALGGSSLGTYVADSFTNGYSSYVDPTGNKVVLDGTTVGTWNSASRNFDRVFTSGKVYFSYLMNYANNGNNKYAAINLLDGTTEKALVGKLYGYDKKLGIDADVDAICTQTNNIENGTGNDYLIVGMYDFSTRQLNATAYKVANNNSSEMIAEEPTGYWHVSTTQSVGYITQLTGFRLNAGGQNGEAVGNVYYDEVRVGTNWFQVTRKQGETEWVAMGNGPTPKLLYVGTNYSPAANPQGTASDITITDAQLTNLGDRLDFAVMWSNSYGVFMTNGNATFNIGSRAGRVTPNWDPLSYGVSTNPLGYDSNFVSFVGANGALTVTTYVQTAFTLTNSTVGDTYYITMSAENNNTNGGFITAPNGADNVPVLRALTINSNVQFYVTDDDTTYPTIENTNYLLNAGFEQGFTSWNQGNAGYSYTLGEAAYSGTSGVKFTSEAGSWANLNQALVGSPSNTYTMKYYIKTHPDGFNVTRFYMKIEFWDGGSEICSNMIDIKSSMTDQWTLFTHSATSPPGTVETRCSLGYDTAIAGGTCYVDSISFSESPPPLFVRIGSTNYPSVEGVWTSAVYRVTDGDLVGVSAGNPLTLSVRAYDTDAEGDTGLQRTNAVSADGTNMSLSVANLTTNNTTNFTFTASSANTKTLSATSVWTFTSISTTIMTNWMAAGSNLVSSTLRDADMDRAGDQLSVTNQHLGFLRVIDDDEDIPAQGTSLLGAPLVLGVDGYYANMIDEFFDGTTLKYQWAWEAEGNTMGAVDNGYYYMWATGAYSQVSMGSRHTYTWVSNVEYRYQFTMANMFTGENFRVSMFLVGNDAGVQPYGYSDYQNPNVLLMQVGDYDASAVQNWGVKLYLKTDAPDVTAYDDSNPAVALLGAMYSINYMTNTTFGFLLNGTNITLYATNASASVSYVTNLTAAQMAYFSTQAYVHVAGKNDNSSTRAGDMARISNVRVVPTLFTTNTVYVMTDGDMAHVSASAPFRLNFPAYDTNSGLSRGISSAATQMNITAVNLTTNNVTNYYATGSATDTKLGSATSIWQWTSIDSTWITSLMSAASNRVSAVLRDADSDRPGDQSSVSNVQFGFIKIADDDVAGPTYESFNVPNGSRTNLLPGSIVIIGYASDAPKNLAFVPTVDIVPGTVIKFTDNGWQASGSFRTGEGILTWTAPDSGVAAGTIVNIYTSGVSVSTGTISGSSFDLSTSGDQVLVYQETASSTSFIFAINADSTGWSDATTTATTAMPTGLVDGVTAVNIGSPERDNGYYSGPRGGSSFVLATNVSTAALWTTDDNAQTWPRMWFSVVSPDVYVEFSDDALVGGISITGLVQDGLSGVYRAGNFANSPTVTVYNSAGTVVAGSYFTSGPSSNGAAGPNPEGMAVGGLVLSGDIYSIYTAKVISVDYDVDRTGDSLSSTQLVILKIASDDDTVAPTATAFQVRVGSRVADIHSGTGTNVVYRITDGDLYNALQGTNLLADAGFESGAAGAWMLWGRCTIENWAQESGTYGLSLDAWDAPANAPYYGGAYQDITTGVEPGKLYTFSIRGKRESQFYASNVLLKIEFIDAADTMLDGTTNDVLPSMPNAFADYVVQARAPATAAKVRVVIEMVYGTGDVGSCSCPWDNASLVTATNPISFVFNASDPDSGLRRMGAMDASAYMNVTIEGLATNNTLNFTKSDSSSFADTKLSTATSVWMWSSFSLTQITNLLPIGSTGQLYRITGNLPDADTDRPGDSTWRNDQQFGFIYIVDDDTNGPTQGVMQPGNMLYNPSFEFAGSWTGAAAYWDHDLESHIDGSAGGTVGNYLRVGTNTGWRAHSGGFEASIPATWDIHTNDNGGWWQEVTNEIGAGSTWIASGYFWSDNTGGKVWTAAWAGIEVEFYPGTNRLPSGKITNYATAFSPPGETWTYFAVTGTAPANAAWARVYVNASGLATGDKGALQFDDISLRAVTNIAMDLVIGGRSVYRTGGGTNVIFRVTDGELAQIGSTNTLKYIFTFYDPTSGILRSTTEEFLNFDMGVQTELQDIRSIYASNLSDVATTLNTASSVFEQVSNYTYTGPRAWADGETGLVWMLMLDGTNEVHLSGPNADSDRDVPDREWGGINQLAGRIVVTDDDTNGPWAWLEFVGSNYSSFGMWNTNPITDADMAAGFDFAFGFWDPSGLFITNVIAGATNVDGNFGNVNINWDLYDPWGTGLVTEAIPPMTNLFSPLGNGSLNATIAVHNVAQLNYYNINTGIWALSVSAQDLDDDRGHNTVTNSQGVVDTTVPWDRKVTGNQMLNFTVYDDDSVAPLFASNANTRPLGVWVGTSNFTGSATTTNAVFTVSDGDLAAAGGTNLVRNFSFDSFNFAYWLNDVTGWRVSDNPVDMHDGTYGAVNDVLTNELGAEYRVLRQQIPASPGEVFDASVYIKAVSVENSFSYLEVQFWNSAGTLIEPDGQFQSAHITADQEFTLATISDITAPAGTVTVSVRGVVAVVNTNYPTAMVNADFHIFDDFMLKKVDSPLKLVFSAYDGTSGLSRPGSDTNTDMNVDVGEWVTNNMANFDYGLSSPDSTAATATNVWRWEHLDPFEISMLYQAGTNKVSATLFDADDDRVNDRMSRLDQQFGFLYVPDDDILPPEPRTITFGGISAKYLVVATNTGADGAISDRWQEGGDAGPSNTGWRVTDGYIANLSAGNPLYFGIGAIDVGSGLARDTEGETNTITLVTIGGVVDGSAAKTSYDISRSSANGPNIVTTNVWTFDGDPDFFTDNIISNLITIGTTTVFATLVDDDTDRPNDQSVSYTQKVGYLAVIDDDVAVPSITSMRYGGQTSPTDADLTNSTFSITGLVQDASGIYGTGSGSQPLYSLYSPTGLIGSANQAMNSQSISDGGGTTATSLGKNNIPVSYYDNRLGVWTVRVTTVDYDNDGWLGDSLTGTSNFPFTVVDDDSLAPNISGASLGSGQEISGCSELFISEYIEGSSNNKYIEIFNGTGNAVDLSVYRIVQYFNGATNFTTGNFIINLTGTLANADTYVVAHSNATIWGGTPEQTVYFLQFNGDDAVALQKNGATIDVVGVIGDTNYPGADVTLSRKSSVTGPTTTFDTNQWTSYAIDTVNLLGSHLGPVTDGDLASASLTITGNVQDVGSGIYAIGALAPHYSIWQPNGTLIINNDTFSQAPAANGDALASAEPLSDAITGFTHDNIMLGMHTAIVTMVDYDNDRVGDTLTNNQTVSFMVIDDDTNAPLLGTSGYTNLLRNSSFEIGGWDGYHAWGWQWDNPDQHGDTWGNGLWTNRHHYSGEYSGTIPGRWGVHTNVDGGWWQEVTNAYGFGSIWDASIWVWSDGGGTAWTSLYNALKIEFYEDDRVTQVGAATNVFTTPGEIWTLISVTGTAPVGTVWSRFVINAVGVGADGALQFDDAVLRPRVPLGVYLGSTPILADGNTTNATFTMTDGQAGQIAAGNPLILSFGAYDAQSGISRGNSSAATQMNVNVTCLVTNDVEHYVPGYSSSGSTNATSSSVWAWDSLTAGEMQNMIDAGSNLISATLFDNDDDRIADRMSNTYVRFGFLKIIDDDTNFPALSAMQVNWGFPDDVTNRVTDQEIHIGQWHMQITVDDFSNISRSNTDNTFAPNFSVINAAGVTGITQRGWEGVYDVSTNTVNLWRNWAGALDYTNVDLGYYTVVFSVEDEDNDRDGDRKVLTNSANVAITSNRFLVVDDDTNAPTTPSHVTIAPAEWTNVNYFVVTFTNSADNSGIWQYRASSNAMAPTVTTNGEPMALLSVTNTFNTVVSNGGFEVGASGLGVPYYPVSTNSWLSLSSDGATGIWDSAEHQTGTNSLRHEIKDGWLWTGGGRYSLISQYISITNDLNQPVLVTISAWFKGNMDYSAYGATGVAFLKAEFLNATGKIERTVDNEVDDDHNGAPLKGKNVTTWTNVILTVTNGPANTRTLLLSCGIESGGSGLALTGWWDNVSVTVKVVDTYGLGAVYTNATEGSNQVWLFSVDDDDDRPDDRLKSGNTNFTIYLDQTPPAQVSGLQATEGAVDSTSEIDLQWTALPNGGGTGLSPWKSYRVYYTDDGSTPTTNSAYSDVNTYPSLGTNTTSSLTLSNLVFGTDYKLGIAGLDRAGNLGPLSTVTNVTLLGFSVTQTLVNAQSAITSAVVSWSATNLQGSIVKEFDLIYADSPSFTEALTSSWNLVGSVSNSWYQDTGSPTRLPPSQLINTMRFYRAAQKDAWRTNRNPRVASAEVYGLKTLRLYRGQNWVALPVIPDHLSVRDVFGVNLPGAASSAGYATKISWYSRTNRWVANRQIWLSRTGSVSQWNFAIGGVGLADTMQVPLNEGCVIEIPTNAAQPQVIVIAGRVPTNAMESPIVRKLDAGVLKGSYNMLSFRAPRTGVHPSEMGLLESGFHGGASPIVSDRIRKFTRDKQQAGTDVWYQVSVSTGRWLLANTYPGSTNYPPVPDNFFMSDDALMIWTVGSTNNWVWTNRVLYPAPTVRINP